MREIKEIPVPAIQSDIKDFITAQTDFTPCLSAEDRFAEDDLQEKIRRDIVITRLTNLDEMNHPEDILKRKQRKFLTIENNR